jgi:N-acetylglucosaminyl-diphospho-decaprenol L-rhamnosyltransferase
MGKNLLDDVTVILVLYKSTDVIFDCLRTLNNIKIIIVDNGDNDQILNEIKKKYKLHKVLKPKKNLGFGKASNLALKEINTKYTLSLNCDSVIKEKDIEILINCLEKYKSTAIAVPQIYNHNKIFCGYGIFPERGKSINRNEYEKKICNVLDNHFPTGDVCVDTAEASVMLLRNEIIKDIGFFDEKYFMYWEDIELFRRVRKKKYSVILSSLAFATHNKSQSVKRNVFTNFIINYNSEISPFIYFNVNKKSFFLYKRLFKYLFRFFIYLIIFKIDKSFKNLAKFYAILIYIFK